MQALAADWKHPSVLLLIALASWYSKEESSCELSILNAVLLLTKTTLPSTFSNIRDTSMQVQGISNHKEANIGSDIPPPMPLTSEHS
jgi:hypothetical protein